LDAHACGTFHQGGDFCGGHGDAFAHGLDGIGHFEVGGCELAIIVARS